MIDFDKKLLILMALILGLGISFIMVINDTNDYKDTEMLKVEIIEESPILYKYNDDTIQYRPTRYTQKIDINKYTSQIGSYVRIPAYELGKGSLAYRETINYRYAILDIMFTMCCIVMGISVLVLMRDE